MTACSKRRAHTGVALTVTASFLLLLAVRVGAHAQLPGKRASYPPTPLQAPQPPDGQWLVEEDGRRYFIDKTPKVEGFYTWIDEEAGIVRPRNFMPIEVFKEDDQYFYFKVYDVEQMTRRPPKLEPSAEELEAAAATYRAEVPSGDRLRFEPFDDGLPNQGSWRNGFELADMNGDSHLDLIHGPPRRAPSVPLIFLGDSAGRWRHWQEATFPPHPPVAPAGRQPPGDSTDIAYDYGDVAVADFNGDGHQDLALAMHLRGAVALVGDGKGRFDLWSRGIGRLEAPGEGNILMTSRSLESVDWNRDGRPDLLLLSEGPASFESLARGELTGDRGKLVYLNQGDGSWKPLFGAEEDRILGDHLALGDFDGDGLTDFASSSSLVGSRRLLNLATADGAWRVLEIEPVRPRAVVVSIAAADFDGDGRLDLALGQRSQELKVQRDGIDLLYNRSGEGGAIVWERRPLFSDDSLERFFTALAAGDVDGDGAVDLIVLTDGGETWVYLGDGQGYFVREESPELEPANEYGHCRGYQIRLVDVDGDGRDELLASFAGEPGSEQLFSLKYCTAGGALRAWRSVPMVASTPAPASKTKAESP